MKFITARNSETGKKFKKLLLKKDEAIAAAHKLADELGIKEWRSPSFVIWGGMSTVTFFNGDNIDTKVWLKIKGTPYEYRPRGNTKAGKELLKRFNNLPKVYCSNLNKCINWEEPFNHIGFSFNSHDYFGFSVSERWKLPIPADCEEITTTRYNELFISKKKNDQD